MNAIRLAIGTFTIVPAGLPSRADRATARTAMLLAPAVGLLLGITAAAVMWGVRAVNDAAYADLLGAALAVGALAYLTRALHLDGLADTVDALGSGKHGEEAVAIARRGDVGAFGVSALVLVLVIDVAALASASASAKATSAVILAVATGRLAAVWACTPGVPAARADILPAALATVAALAEHLGADNLKVSHHGLRQGVAALLLTDAADLLSAEPALG